MNGRRRPTDRPPNVRGRTRVANPGAAQEERNRVLSPVTKSRQRRPRRGADRYTNRSGEARQSSDACRDRARNRSLPTTDKKKALNARRCDRLRTCVRSSGPSRSAAGRLCCRRRRFFFPRGAFAPDSVCGRGGGGGARARPGGRRRGSSVVPVDVGRGGGGRSVHGCRSFFATVGDSVFIECFSGYLILHLGSAI